MFYIQAKVPSKIYILKTLLRHLLIRNSWEENPQPLTKENGTKGGEYSEIKPSICDKPVLAAGVFFQAQKWMDFFLRCPWVCRALEPLAEVSSQLLQGLASLLSLPVPPLLSRSLVSFLGMSRSHPGPGFELVCSCEC